MTGRRTKPTRKASGLRASSFSIENPIKKEESVEDHTESSSSPDTLNKFTQNNKQVGEAIRFHLCPSDYLFFLV